MPIYRWYLEAGRCVALGPGILQTHLEERVVLPMMFLTASAKRKLHQRALSGSGTGELSGPVGAISGFLPITPVIVWNTGPRQSEHLPSWYRAAWGQIISQSGFPGSPFLRDTKKSLISTFFPLFIFFGCISDLSSSTRVEPMLPALEAKTPSN